MSSNEQNEFGSPTPGDNNRQSARFLPRFFRSEANLKFLQATVDQLTQPGVAEKLSGFFGRTIAKGFKSEDNYIGDVNKDRLDYQFEPALVIKDVFDNVTFYKDYNDYINTLKFFNVNTANHDKINQQESYPWNPNIDWDKFVNFREYYWLPDGPLSVPVQGQARDVTSTFTVTVEEADGDFAFVFNGKNTRNPSLRLFRGQKYRFEIDTPGHPFAVAVTRSFTPGNAVIVATREGIRQDGLFDSQLYGETYDIGDWLVLPQSGSVTFEDDENVSTLYPDGIRYISEAGNEIANVYIEKGILEFTVPFNSPDRLYYISQNSIDTSGLFKIYDIEENSFLDVEEDIIGKKYYTSSNGVEFTNGLKVSFRGNTQPEEYSSGEYYVEGVGNSIKLIPKENLTITTSFNNDVLQPFDEQAFDELPFGSAKSYPIKKDYLTVSRESADLNAWSRSNRWFHRTVIEDSFRYNEIPIDLKDSQKAKRPIIEFEPGLKLYNYGTFAKQFVDVVDTFTKDVFSTIEGSVGYNIDGVDLIEGMRVLFTADTDVLVNGAIYEVKYVNIDNANRITLIPTLDTLPQLFENVLVQQGKTYAGKIFFYNGSTWKLAQDKTDVNQAPLFDLCCPQGEFYGDTEIFNSTSFKGCKVFSYKQGSGAVDPELGFPLSYRNINNTGDIVFDFNLLTDSFNLQINEELVTVKTDTAFLRKYSDRTNFVYQNGWSSVPVISKQKVLRQYTVSPSQRSVFEIDVYENAAILEDLEVSVFVNNEIRTDYSIDVSGDRVVVRFTNLLELDDVVLLKTHSSAAKNNTGLYEIPSNLEKNPLNEDIVDFTLGEVIDHVGSMIEDIPDFAGTFPGNSNIRDLGNLDIYGKRFLKHSGPWNLPAFSITSKEFNIVRAIEYGKTEYSKFKRNFIKIATDLGFTGETKQHVDKILTELNLEKVSTQPFYFSDMVGYKSGNSIQYEVIDEENPFYNLTELFALDNLNNQAVNIYLNGAQLLFDRDYYFTAEGFAYIDAGQKLGDTIEIVEYSSTDGSYIPPTPTKLGLYPRFEPEITIDEQWLDSTADNVDARIAHAIYGENLNNHLQRGWFYPVYLDRKTAMQNDANETVVVLRLKGSSKVFYAPANKFVAGSLTPTEEYKEYPIGHAFVTGHDGSFTKCYKDYRDILWLELEKRIYNNIKIDYAKTQINIHDYVGGRFRDTGLTDSDIDRILIKDFTAWNRIVKADYTENKFFQNQNQFTFNYSQTSSVVDDRNLPGFWRAVYKDAFDTDRPHTHPWEMLGFTRKPIWWETQYGAPPYTSNNTILWRDLEDGVIRKPDSTPVLDSKYTRPGLRDFLPVDSQGQLKPPVSANYAKNIIVRNLDDSFKFGDNAPVESAWRRSSEYAFSLIKAILLNRPSDFLGKGFDVARIQRNLAGQFVYTETGKNTQLTNLVFPNTYSDNFRIPTSGLVNYIYNLIGSNVLSVYDDYKNNIKAIRNQLGFKLGGFTDKQKINLILQSKSPSEENSQGLFVPQDNFEIFLNTSSPIDNVNYSGVIIELRADGFIVQGYDSETPIFKYYKTISTQGDPTVVVGAEAEDVVQWTPNRVYVKGQIVENAFAYYRVTQDFTSGSSFDLENLAKLSELPVTGGQRAQFRNGFDKNFILELTYGSKLADVQSVVDFILGYGEYLKDQGFIFDYFDTDFQKVEDWKTAAKEFLFWSAQGWSEGTVISVSPAAYKLMLKRDFSVADDIFDRFYEYSLLSENGNPLPREFGTILREKNSFSLSVDNTDNGIYNLTVPLVQKEHVVLLDNKTVFSDILYQPYSGYRQERIKVLGFRSDNWNGSLNIPGFVFDDAKVTEWEPWQDYEIGSLVKHKEFFYVAIETAYGSAEFNFNFWNRLSNQPEPQLMTNFDFRANQFTDYYDVDSIGFDRDQQRLAQHLIGYQKRDYLANIINDDVSQFKFYQGFIKDKGTRNAIDKLFDALGGNESGLDFYEEWAVQSGIYGQSDKIRQLGIPLKEDKILESPQGIELVDYIPNDIFDTTYRVRPDDLITRPEDFSINCFPTKQLDEYILTGGYVHEDDIDYKIESVLELQNVDVNLMNIGEYIWVTDVSPNDWNVFRIINSNITVNSLTVNPEQNTLGETTATIEFASTELPDIRENDVIAILGAQLYDVTGFYQITEAVSGNILVIEIPEDNSFQDFVDEEFECVVLKSERVDSFANFNDVAQESRLDDQKVWVDSFRSDLEWAMLQNTKVYSKITEQINPNDIEDSSAAQDVSNRFGTDIASSNDNRFVFVSAPGFADGEVYFYRRNQDTDELVLNDSINNPGFNLYQLEQSNFGQSISVSDDGEYLAIGAPAASEVKTKYKKDWLSTREYAKGDIVRHKGSLWRAQRTILPEVGDKKYKTFDSHYLMEDRKNDSAVLQTLITGSPLLPGRQVNHLLVRAPADLYLASTPGDWLKLAWNEFTYFNGQIDTARYPFDNTIQQIGFDGQNNFLDGFHQIKEKVDKIFFLPQFDILLQVGDTVQTNSGFAIVCYVDFRLGDMTIYLKDIRGNFDATGTLERFNFRDASVEIIGEYQEIDYGFVEDFNGFWAIALDSSDEGIAFNDNNTNYFTDDVYFDEGKGLVIADLIKESVYPAQKNRNTYLNITDEIKRLGTVTTTNLKASMLHNLGEYWVARMSTSVTAELSQRDTVGFYLNDEISTPYFDRVAEIGLEFSQLNKIDHVIEDIWDGYIDVTVNAEDPNTRELLLFAEGDIVRDKQRPFNIFQQPADIPLDLGNEAEVVFVKNNIGGRFDRQRIYIRILNGNWNLQNNIAVTNISRERQENGNLVERIMGDIVDYRNDVVVPNSNAGIGKFLVVTSETVSGVDFEIQDAEYHINSFSELDAPAIPPSVPSSLNRDYEQVFNISANTAGIAGEQNTGAVVILRKSGPNAYSLSKVITSEKNFDIENAEFGKQVRLVQNGINYSLYVSSNANNSESGFVEIFEHGPVADSNFKGTWNPDLPYVKDDVVLHLGNYYLAKININTQTQTSIFNTNFWTEISWRRSTDIDFRGQWTPGEEYIKDSVVQYENELYVALTNISSANSQQNPQLDSDRWLRNSESIVIDGSITDSSVDEFAEEFAINNSGDVLVIKSKTLSPDPVTQFSIYRKALSGNYVKQDATINIQSSDVNFDLDYEGNTLALGIPDNNDAGQNVGKLIIYNLSDQSQTVIYPPAIENLRSFGYMVAFNQTSLIVGAIDLVSDQGKALVYEVLRNQFIYSEIIAFDRPVDSTSQKLHGRNNHIYVGVPNSENNLFTGSFVDFRKDQNSLGWTVARELIPSVDLEKINGVFLYNKRTEQKITSLDYIDPVQGKIAGPAEQNISYKVPYDPAQYNVGDTANDVNWAEEHVGKIWWNTGNARFTYAYQGDINYQRSNWNELQPGATVDVYEWVESNLLPSSWDSITNTAQGDVLGITGVTLYGNDRYSKRFTYDRESQTFREVYYYWVKNKRTVPNIEGRTLSALDIARLIAQPREQGYRHVNFLSDNRLVLNNCKPLIENEDVVLNIDYVLDKLDDQNTHSAYQIITDGLASSVPHTDIEQKWFDSLIGVDKNQKSVPDISLPENQKYGVQTRPRQSMFRNRPEALKQVITRTNIALESNLIVDDRDISDLLQADEIPNQASGLYDLSVDTKDEMLLLGVKFTQAELKPVIINGRIIRVEIINRGRGYKLPPSYVVQGTGSEAAIDLDINNLGQITAARVTNPGKNYDGNTKITVRPFAVLVNTDEDAQGRWSIYNYQSDNDSWFRTRIQTFDVSRYWEYADWYDQGFNQLSEIDHYVDAQYQLNALEDNIGDTIKIANVGSGGWLLLRKINNTDQNSAVDYEVVGRQNGTIQFKASLYDYNLGGPGFDNRSFGELFYDDTPTTELRIILETIRDKLFTGNLRTEYNQLFIASLRYVLNEQKNPDWFFKTSFVKLAHSAGTLDQDLTYNFDNLQSYVDYVNEVKPFSTVVREFVSHYTKNEDSNTSVSDFDLPASYNLLSEKIEPVDVFVTEGIAVHDSELLEKYPRKYWLDNFGYSITEISLIDGGSLYTTAPRVTITGGFGKGAKAQAFIGYGSVTKIIVTHPGTGYTKRPTVEIQPPPNSAGTTARAVANLGDSPVRSVSTRLKFDRNTISNLYTAETLAETEIFTGTGADTDFTLKWPMDLKTTSISVTIDGQDIFQSQFEIENTIDSSKSYTRQLGKIRFANPPAKDAVIIINYHKNISLLNAVDRIKFAYTPDTGMFGAPKLDENKYDYSQLMEGVDFGGVEIKSFDFVTSSGWDTEGWFNDIWDDAEPPEDEVVTLDDSTNIIILNEPLEDGVTYNIYRVSYKVNTDGIEEIYSNVRLDDPNFGTPGQTNLNAVCAPLQGDGSTQVVDLDDLGIRVDPQAEEDRVTIVVRKTTSDGAMTPDRNIYDADIDGGRLDYGNAKGVNAEEIVIDGDGFVTEFNAGGVEELVPGQILDTLDMQVTTKGDDSSTVVKYRIFKDILNRTSYKRIDTAATVLTEALGQDDLSIVVESTENLPTPNRNRNLPGVIWLGKERIEYFVKEENKLRQIRRGTLGTGVANVHPVGTEVYDQSALKNIPYRDLEQTQTATNVDEVVLNFRPASASEFEMFVNGIRLNGRDVAEFDPAKDQDSPEGDVIRAADFELDYSSEDGDVKVIITNSDILEMSTKNIVIVRKAGSLWQNRGESLAETNTNIGFFLRSGN